LSIVIPSRNEDRLGFTVRRAIESRQGTPLDIVIVEDGSGRQYGDIPPEQPTDVTVRYLALPRPVGNCYCRHVGIEMARNDAVLVLDAHANFHDTDQWAANLVALVQAFPQAIGCCVSVGIPWDTMSMDPDPDTGRQRGRYYGAAIQWKTRHSCGRYVAMGPKWDGTRGKDAFNLGNAVTVGLALGGAYALSRSWYLDHLKGPWALNRGWGTSEQAICLPNWCLGGESMLYPVEIGHMYRTNRPGTPHVPYATMCADIHWNQYRLIHTLPMPQAWRAELEEWIGRNPLSRGDRERLKQHESGIPWREYCDYVDRNCVRDMLEYCETWAVTREETGK
jgi:hypothetical protein